VKGSDRMFMQLGHNFACIHQGQSLCRDMQRELKPAGLGRVLPDKNVLGLLGWSVGSANIDSG